MNTAGKRNSILRFFCKGNGSLFQLGSRIFETVLGSVKPVKRKTKKIPELNLGDFVYFERKRKTYFKGLNSKVTTPRVADFTSKDLVAKKENPLSFL